MSQKEGMVLVGIGKLDLKDLILKINTEQEKELLQSLINSPPRWRRESICDEDEIQAFVTFTEFVTDKILGE